MGWQAPERRQLAACSHPGKGIRASSQACCQQHAALLTGGRCRPQHPWGRSALPPHRKKTLPACLPAPCCCRSLLVLLEDASLGQLPPGSAPLPPATARRRLCNVRKGSAISLRPLPAGPGGRPRTECFLMVRLLLCFS